MSKTLQMILSLLRNESVLITSIITLLQTENTASILGVNSLLGTLLSSREDILSPEIVDFLIKIIELTLNEQKEKAEDTLNSLIVTNSSTHYQEIITIQGEDIGNKTIISEYSEKVLNETLDYYVFIPLKPSSRFTIGDLTFDINSDSEFSFTTTDGLKKSGSYKFRVKIKVL